MSEQINPLVSVVIPAYNAESTLEQCLESISTQSLQEFEVFLVDDGSTDNTAEIAHTFSEKDSRFTLIQQQNQFAGVARNNGMSRAHGKYLYFLDADDYLEDNCLESLVSTAEQYQADIVATRSTGIDSTTNETFQLDYAVTDVPFEAPIDQVKISESLFQSFIGWPWDKLFLRKFIQEQKLLFQPLRTSNDAFFVFLALAESQCTVCLDTHLVYHRVNNSNSLEGSRAKSYECAVKAASSVKQELKNRGLFEATAKSFNRWVANFMLWNLSSLPYQVGTQLLELARPLLEDLPDDTEYYPNARDGYFVHLVQGEPSETLLTAVENTIRAHELEDEIARLHSEIGGLREVVRAHEQYITDLNNTISEIYNSHSY